MNQTPQQNTTPSFERSAKPLSLALKPSRVWLIALLALHACAVIAVIIAAVPLIIKILLPVLILTSLYFQYRQHQKDVYLVWRTGNRWFINEDVKPAELHAVNFFSRWLVILSLAKDKPANDNKFLSGLTQWFTAKQKFIIPFDSLDKDTFRLLRVRLRIEGYELLNPPDETIK